MEEDGMKKLIGVAVTLLTVALSASAASPLETIERAGVFPGLKLDTGNSTEVMENKDLPLLVGVVITENVKKAILFDKGQKKRIKAKEGEEVSGFKVAKILPDSVVLEKGGKSYTVKIFTKEAASYRKKFTKAKFAKTNGSPVVLAGSRSKTPSSRVENSKAFAKKGIPTSPPTMAKKSPPAPRTAGRQRSLPFAKELFRGGIKRRSSGSARSFIELLKGLRKK